MCLALLWLFATVSAPFIGVCVLLTSGLTRVPRLSAALRPYNHRKVRQATGGFLNLQARPMRVVLLAAIAVSVCVCV